MFSFQNHELFKSANVTLLDKQSAYWSMSSLSKKMPSCQEINKYQTCSTFHRGDVDHC